MDRISNRDKQGREGNWGKAPRYARRHTNKIIRREGRAICRAA